MADKKINELSELTSLGTGDLFAVGDVTASNVLKKITRENLITDLGIITASSTTTLTNKTLDADSNTVSNIGDEELKAGIDATKIGAGGVTNTEFGYIGTLTSDAQTQLDAKAPIANP
ncbi:MAG: hypothetical protein V2I33_22860, partial [Kangiellaceae bacterium]|nr:hypothetical protein [Kangiellaceae bacterium]